MFGRFGWLGRAWLVSLWGGVVFFGQDYDVGFVSDVFFWATYFCSVAYGCDFAFEVACYVVDC